MEAAEIPAYALIAVLAGAAWIVWRCASLFRPPTREPNEDVRETRLFD
jgi:hypothetical protein